LNQCHSVYKYGLINWAEGWIYIFMCVRMCVGSAEYCTSSKTRCSGRPSCGTPNQWWQSSLLWVPLPWPSGYSVWPPRSPFLQKLLHWGHCWFCVWQW
jgi:hypothetical protein